MKKLNFKSKILLLALVPLVLLGLLTTLLGLYQTSKLGNQNVISFSNKIYDLRRDELKNYTQIARSAVGSFNKELDPDALDKAKDILRAIRFGDDGYIFVYDDQGTNLVHPIKPQLEGANLWELSDKNGVKLIQELVANAKVGGGYTNYQWDKPSEGKNIGKIGYSSMINEWKWVLGTGLYVDDLDEAISAVKSDVDSQVSSAGALMAILALTITSIFAFIGFRFTAHESALADTKLRAMAFKASSSKETERSRVARELQKDVNSHLVLAKQRTRELIEQEISNISYQDVVSVEEEVSEAIKQIYRIIGQLRPVELDEGGLDEALESLVEKYTKQSNCIFRYRSSGKKVKARWEIEIAIYRAVNLALDNIIRHANVDGAEVWINFKPSVVRVTIKDQGVGFDVKNAKSEGRSTQGSSINEIETLIGSLGGKLNIFSTPNVGTMIRFDVPLMQPK